MKSFAQLQVYRLRQHKAQARPLNRVKPLVRLLAKPLAKPLAKLRVKPRAKPLAQKVAPAQAILLPLEAAQDSHQSSAAAAQHKQQSPRLKPKPFKSL